MVDAKQIWSSAHLPTLPAVAMRLLELARDPDADFKDVIALVKADPAITAKILKSANSSYFGFKTPVTSIERAVPLLGTTVVTTLTLSFTLVEAAMNSGPLAQHYTSYWKQSIVQAVAAEAMAELYGRALAGDCFLTGLLLDLGRLAMLKTVTKDYLPVLTEWEASHRSLKDLESSMLGIDHVRVGAQLLRDWRLPSPLVKAVSLHHAPLEKVVAELPDAESTVGRIVVIAAAVGDYFCTGDKGPALERAGTLASTFFGMTRPALEEYLERTRERIEQAGELFVVDFDGLEDSAELMAQANEQLAKLAVREHMVGTQAELQRQAIEHANQELETRNQELQERATRDALTGLYNRTYFAETLAAAVNATSRSAGLIGVLFTDIDHFKKLNDTCGHAFGDEVLREVAKLHLDVLRKSDVVARYGGEEFVVLVTHPTEKGLEKVAGRLRSAIESAVFVCEGKRFPVTISIGAAIALPQRDPGDLPLRLVAEADEAMYDAKQNGRNQFRIRTLIDPEDQHLSKLIAEKRFSRWLVQGGVFDVPTISRALFETPAERMKIGSLAQMMNFLTAEQVEEIRKRQELSNERFGRCAIDSGFLSEDQVAVLLAIQVEPPNLLARTLTMTGRLEKSRAEELLACYRLWLASTAPVIEAVTG